MGKLVRIEVENFKSYKGHQTIGPFHQFTCVIGPNGAGKSNLMDAISFVLGVPSSQLRSQNVKDMIFRPGAYGNSDSDSGTAVSPQSAHVLAVYQTEDGREIRFKRTVTTNGQSEYRINEKQVLYSQYNMALEKENILVKAKNFLVFQGDVESVVSQNPKELTRLIEQISGSWEFKEGYDRLKQEMERAIENSAHTFNKKRGVTAEIKQYKEQKAEAEKFETMVKERRELVVQYLLWKLYHVEKKTHDLEAEANKKRIAANGASDDQVQFEDKFKNARKEQALIHRERTRKELGIKNVKRELDEQQPASIGLLEKIDHTSKRIEQIKSTGLRLERDFEQQTQSVQSLEQSLAMADQSENTYNATIPKSGYDKGPVLNATQRVDYEQRKQQVSVQAMEEQQRLQFLNRKRVHASQEVEDQKSTLEQLQVKEAELQSDRQRVIDEGNTLTADLNRLTTTYEKRKADLSNLEQQRKTVHQREQELNEQLQQVLSKLMEAKMDRRESEKEARFRESLAMMKQIFPGVHGKLSDLCRPTQRKYDGAVATAIGRHLDSIVVDHQKTAIECIQYMREQRVGVATFLPLNSLSIPTIQDRYRSFGRGVRLAVDVIKCDKTFEPVVQYVCGNTLVCDNIGIAKRISFEMDQDVKTVTLDSTVIHRSGLMTGGQSTGQSPSRWEEQDVEELMRTRDSCLAELNALSKNKRMGSAEELARSDCTGLESQMAMLRDEITTLERKLDSTQGSLAHIKGKVEESEVAYRNAQSRLAAVEADVQRAEEAIAAIEDQVFEDFCADIGVNNIREYEALQFGLPQQVMERQAQFAAQRSRIQTQLAFEKEQLAELQERLTKLTKSLQQDESSLIQCQQELTTLDQRKSELDVSLGTLESDLAGLVQQEENKQTEIATIRKELEAKGKDVEAYLKEMAKFEGEIEKTRSERVTIFRKCKLEDIELPLIRGSMADILMDEDPSFGGSDSMDLDEPSQRSIRSTDWVVEVDYSSLGSEQRNDDGQRLERSFQDEIKSRGEEIDRMAPNLKAIDRLEGVEQRLRDAEQAFDEARTLAKKAKEQFQAQKHKRYTRFYDAFSHISEQIDQVYKALTKSTTFPLGGTAYLSLEDSEEPYLEGVKYHAMPPMKRFRDMELLSGGEKSLAALALLFAIHSYKPSPFFVLDEVDAALDNTNVARVAVYLREQANDALQFIVISLKNTLYEKAHSLVGIYHDHDMHSSKTLTLMLDAYKETSQVM